MGVTTAIAITSIWLWPFQLLKAIVAITVILAITFKSVNTVAIASALFSGLFDLRNHFMMKVCDREQMEEVEEKMGK